MDEGTVPETFKPSHLHGLNTHRRRATHNESCSFFYLFFYLYLYRFFEAAVPSYMFVVILVLVS